MGDAHAHPKGPSAGNELVVEVVVSPDCLLLLLYQCCLFSRLERFLPTFFCLPFFGRRFPVPVLLPLVREHISTGVLGSHCLCCLGLVREGQDL